MLQAGSTTPTIPKPRVDVAFDRDRAVNPGEAAESGRAYQKGLPSPAGWIELIIGLFALFAAIGLGLEAQERIFDDRGPVGAVARSEFETTRGAIISLESTLSTLSDDLLSARLRSQPISSDRLDVIEAEGSGSLALLSMSFAERGMDGERGLVQDMTLGLTEVMGSLAVAPPEPIVYDSAAARLTAMADDLEGLVSSVAAVEAQRVAESRAALRAATETAVERLALDVAVIAIVGLSLATSLIVVADGSRRIRWRNAQDRNSNSTDSAPKVARSASTEITRRASIEDSSDQSDPSAERRTLSPVALRSTAR